MSEMKKFPGRHRLLEALNSLKSIGRKNQQVLSATKFLQLFQACSLSRRFVKRNATILVTSDSFFFQFTR